MNPLRVFGGELKHYRTRAGMSQEELGSLVFLTGDMIGKIENGQRVASERTTESLDAVPELNTGGALTRIREHIKGARMLRAMPGWFWEWTAREAEAVTLRLYEPLLVPGLLQTADYARAVLRTRVGDTDEEIEELVSARLERQSVLSKDKPPTLWIVIDEGVVRRPVGGPAAMREQLNALVEAARRPNIVIQVIPSDAGAHEGLRGPFMIADFADAPSAAWQDGAVYGQLVDDPGGVTAVVTTFDTLKSEALPRSASLALMEEVAKTWTLAMTRQ